MTSRRRPPLRATVAALVMLPWGAASAQRIFQAEGGASTIAGGYGSRVQFWTPEGTGWIGLGYDRGWRVSGQLRRRLLPRLTRDSIVLGADYVGLGNPTDLFGSAPYLFTQGVSWQRTSARTRATLFAGTSGTGVGSMFFSASRSERPLGHLDLVHSPTPALRLESRIVAARRQTMTQSVEWHPRYASWAAALSGGVGANRPFGESSWRYDSERLQLRAAYAWHADGFQRADAPLPLTLEHERENLLVIARPVKWLQLTGGRQHFRNPADTMGGGLVTVHQASSQAQFSGWRLGAGAFHSEAFDRSNLSSFALLGRDLGWRVSSTLMLLRSQTPGLRATQSAQLSLREAISPTFTLSQVVSQNGRSTTAAFGGSVQRGFSSLTVDYQTLYLPLRDPSPFVRTLLVGVRLQLGKFATQVSTTIDPFGQVNYTASTGTYFYQGIDLNAGMRPVAIKFERYAVRGVVRDEAGEPIEGAALEIGGNLVITNSRGQFFLRTNQARPLPLDVAFDDFTAIGDFELIAAPSLVTPVPEEQSGQVIVVLRRPRGITAPSGPKLPPPAPASGSAGSGMGTGL